MADYPDGIAIHVGQRLQQINAARRWLTIPFMVALSYSSGIRVGLVLRRVEQRIIQHETDATPLREFVRVSQATVRRQSDGHLFARRRTLRQADHRGAAVLSLPRRGE